MHRNRSNNSSRNNPGGNAVRPDYRPPMGGGGGGRSDYTSLPRHGGGQSQGTPYAGSQSVPAAGGLDLLNAYAQVSQLSQQQNLLGLLGALNQSAVAAATTGPTSAGGGRSPVPYGRESKPSLLGSPPSLLAMPNVVPTNTFVRGTGSSSKRQGDRDYHGSSSSSQSQSKRPRPGSSNNSLVDQLRIEEEKLRFQENLLARQIKQIQAAQAATQRPGASPPGAHRHDDRRGGGRNDRRSYGSDHHGSDRQRGGARNRHQQYRGDTNQNRRRRDDKNSRGADVVPSQDSEPSSAPSSVTKVPKIVRGPHYCYVCGIENTTAEALDEHNLSPKHVKVIDSLTKMAEKSKKPLETIVESIDKLRLNKEIEAKLKEIKAEEKELAAAQSADGQLKPKRYYCNICSVLFEGNVAAHRQSEEHKKLLAAKEGTSIDDNSKPCDKGSIVSQDKEEKRDLVFGFVIDPSHTQGFRLPRYNPQSAVGAEFLEPATGWWCRICHRFYHNEESAKTSHCMTKSHYENVKRYIRDNRTYYPGKEAAKEQEPEEDAAIPPSAADDEKQADDPDQQPPEVKEDQEAPQNGSAETTDERPKIETKQEDEDEPVETTPVDTSTNDVKTTRRQDDDDGEGEATAVPEPADHKEPQPQDADEPMETAVSVEVAEQEEEEEEPAKETEATVTDDTVVQRPETDADNIDAAKLDVTERTEDIETILSEINDILNKDEEPMVCEGAEVSSTGLVKQEALDMTAEELDYTDDAFDGGREEYEPEHPTASDDEEKVVELTSEQQQLPVHEEVLDDSQEPPVIKTTPVKTPKAKYSGKRSGRGRGRGRGVRR